ncbi:MAG: non-canonical purine NTP pyrophosphatase [Acidimicrobiia bacterium]|nr:non-canonical purine NTP pyrophosphatase [Acidimicrobiia bacterium]
MTGAFVLATGNADKAREIVEILGRGAQETLEIAPLDVCEGAAAYMVAPAALMADVVAALPELGEPPDVEETGATIEENARIKAAGWCMAFGLPAIADDTGLDVDALGGEPGVRSARYAGEGASYAENVAKLVAEMEGVEPEGRTCRFATVALAYFPDGHEVVSLGTVEGVVADEPRGEQGFGYDPVFVPVGGDGRTFAQMSPAEKHAISHRGRAFRALAASLGNGIGTGG